MTGRRHQMTSKGLTKNFIGGSCRRLFKEIYRGNALSFFLIIFFLLPFAGCGTSHKAITPKGTAQLSDEEQRRYDYFYLEAVNQRQQENYDVAFDLLQHCLSICPTAPTALYELSAFYSALGDKEKALSLMQQAVTYDPDNYWYQESLAEAYYNNQQQDNAISIYEDMVARFPRRSAELLPILVNLYQATEQYDKEIEALDRMEERFGSSEEIEMEKFRAYFLKKDSEAAFRSMEELVATHPDELRYRLLLGDVCLNYDKLDEARRAYESVLAVEPDNDMGHLGMANWYNKSGNDKRADAIVDSLVVYGHLPDERRIQLTSQLIRQMEARQDTLAIDNLFSRILAQPQTSIAMPKACASYYIQAQKPDSLIIPFVQAILTVEPDNVEALKQLLYYAVEHNDTEEVRERSRALLTYYPDELYAYYYLVITALRDKDEQRAINYCLEGVSHIGEESDTELCTELYTMLGDLYFSNNEKTKGYVAYDSALVYNPSKVSVLNNSAYYLSLENRDLDRAEEMSRVTITKEPDNSTYLDTYAWILFQKERYDEARHYMEQALKTDTTSSAVLMEHAGDISFKCGLVDEALGYWKQALEQQQKDRKESGTKPTAEERLAENKLKKKIRLKKWIK